jgi:hypothetical protein
MSFVTDWESLLTPWNNLAVKLLPNGPNIEGNHGVKILLSRLCLLSYIATLQFSRESVTMGMSYLWPAHIGGQPKVDFNNLLRFGCFCTPFDNP